MDWMAITSQLGTFALGSGALAWLAKTITTHRLTIETETFKATLKADHDSQLEKLRAELRVAADREVEALKAELRVAAYTREVRYARLQERRMDVVSELYANLVATELDLGSLVKPFQLVGEPPEGAKQSAAAASANRFMAHYRQNRIFFSEDVCQAIDALAEHHYQAWVGFTTWRPEWVQQEPSLAKEAFAARQQAWATVSKEVPAARKVIEKSMRELLGVLDHA